MGSGPFLGFDRRWIGPSPLSQSAKNIVRYPARSDHMRCFVLAKSAVFVVGVAAALTIGCGDNEDGGASGSGGSAGSGGEGPLTGKFTDTLVGGLEYSTPTQSGETNADGEFKYLAGETVTFKVGDIVLGQAVGAATLTPFDLAGSVPPVTAIEIHREVNRINSSSNRLNSATPLEVAANIAVFLQTLDEDGDSNTGITIPAQMHTLATGASLDFHQHMLRFPDNFSLRKLMAAGRAAGVWGGTREIRDTYYALDALYAGMGLTPSIEAPGVRSVDNNADSVIDTITTYTYDAKGNLTKTERDNNADGVIDDRTSVGFDGNANRVLNEFDNNGDGLVDGRNVSIYDDNGNLTTIERDNTANGVVDSRTQFSYDNFGDNTLIEEDTNADGVVDSRTTYAYDADGNQILVEDDDDANGAVDSRRTNTYDADGNLIKVEDDNDADGVVDSRRIASYDANGNRTLLELDNNADGAVDARNTSTYDVNGDNVLFESDTNADGSVDYRQTYTHDAFGNILTIETDTNGDGVTDAIVTYSYDAIGNRLKLETDSNADGVVDSTDTSTYDANGNLTMEEGDSNGDGVADSRTLIQSYTGINRWKINSPPDG
jgi:hypothetical protein